MNSLNIHYSIGSDSLLGLGEGDLFKYSNNLKIYLKKYSILTIVFLFILLLFKKIILKPKIENKKLLFKLRYKPNLLSKDSTWIKCYIMKKEDKSFSVNTGNKIAYFSSEDMQIKTINHNGQNLNVPIKYEKFIIKYKKELLYDFYQKHELVFSSKNEEKAIKFLFDVTDKLEKYSTSYWIEGGTLLGAVRDKKLIPWDHDIDMGMINKSDEKTKEVIDNLKKYFYVSVKGFKELSGVWNLGKYRVLKVYPRKNIFFKDNLCIDIFIYYLDGNNYKYVVWNKNAQHERKYFDKLEKIEFYGKAINVPNDFKNFLEVKYGSDWQVPKKEWNVALDDGSVLNENISYE